MPDSKEERQEVIRRLKECVFEEEEVNAAFPGPHSGSAKEGRVISHKLRTIPGSDLFESFKISPEAFIHLLAGECLRGDLQIFDPFDCEVTKEDFMPLFEELEKTGAILKFAVTEGEAKPWRGKNDRVTTLALEQFKEWRYLEDDFKNLAKRYPNLAGTPPTEAQKRDPAKAEKGAGKKATALTRQAQKRLEEIVPVVKNFCQTLSASIKQEHGTVTHAEAKDWQKEALTLAEEQGAWNEVVKPEDVQAVDFAAHAVSEHKERLKGRLAQLVLAREGFGTKSQKALNKFFR